MKPPRVAHTHDRPSGITCDALIIGVIPDEDQGIALVGSVLDEAANQVLCDQARKMGLGGKKDDCHILPAPEAVAARKIVLIGLGPDPTTPSDLRHAAGVAVRASGKVGHIAVALPTPTSDDAIAIVEGALLGGYRVAGTKKNSDEKPWETLTVWTPADSTVIDHGVSTATAVWWVRDLVNTPPNELYPESFANRVSTQLADLPIDVEVYDHSRLAEEGFGGLLGVGGGSARPPRLVALRYHPEDARGHLAFVGKGITFDSGGLSLKPANSMVGMKYDMTGAATVTGAIMAAAELGAPVAITAWLCLAENMPSGSAQRPGDVITIRGGKTVEVLNTDAEGRLVLADGLQAASEEQPDLIVDVATLTGAARIALGERYAGLMGDPPARGLVEQAAEEAGELVWSMPLPEELRAGLNTEVADIANVATGSPLGGMLVAGLFLREFVGQRSTPDGETAIPWAHLDVAGPASNSGSPFGYTPKGPTGALTRTLVRLAMTFDSAEFAPVVQ